MRLCHDGSVADKDSTGQAQSAESDDAKVVRQAPFLVLAFTALVALVIGYVIFKFIQWYVKELWTNIPADVFENSVPWWYLFLLPLLAGVIVALFRKKETGYNPLAGLSAAPITLPSYPFILLAILFTLVGGLVLGPEVALMSTGSTIGWTVAQVGDYDAKRPVVTGSLGSLCALLVDPLLDGSSNNMNLSSGYVFSWNDVWLGIIAGLLTAVVVALTQLLAIGFTKVRGGDRPIIWEVALGGLIVGIIAFAYQQFSEQPVNLVLTSGETLITSLVTVGSASLILWTVATKLLAYAVSMGMGFRGGPYFPVMFAGAGIGAVLGQWFHGQPQGTALAGIVAAVIFLAKPKWLGVVVIAVILGVVMGGWNMVLVVVVGAVMGKLVPRLGNRDHLVPVAPVASPSSGT